MTGVEIRLTDPHRVTAEWEVLAERTAASPFVHPGWVLAWQSAFGRGRLILPAAYRASTLVGLMPLQVRGGVVATPTNWHSPEYTVVGEDGDVASALLAAAVRRNRQRLQLAFVDESLVEEVTRLAGLARQGVLSRVLERGPYIKLEDSFAAYEQTLRPHLRSELARRRRRLADRGTVSLDVREKADEEALDEFFLVEAAGWKGRVGTAIAADRATQRFYIEVARWAADHGWLRLALLRVGGRAIAGDLAVQCNGVHYLLKTGFDPEYRQFAPGKLLRHSMIERAFSDRLDVYEFLGVDDAWKLEWTTTVHPRMLAQAFARTLPGRVDRVAHEYGRPAAKAVFARGRRWLGR